MSTNILICGVGGQGTVLAAKVIAQAALSKGENVLSAETIGMAQRGGSVVSHVRIGEDVYSPLIAEKQADIVIAFETAEAVRNLPYLKSSGTVVVSRTVMQPVTASLSGDFFDADEMIRFLKKNARKVIAVDTESACRAIGNTKVVNMILLGAACGEGIFTKDELKAAVRSLVKPDFYAVNEQAIDSCGGFHSCRAAISTSTHTGNYATQSGTTKGMKPDCDTL